MVSRKIELTNEKEIRHGSFIQVASRHNLHRMSEKTGDYLDFAVTDSKIVDNSPVFIFDLDFCLYDSPSLVQSEMNKAKQIFMSKYEKTEEEYEKCNKNYANWISMFWHECKMHPEEYSLDADMHDFNFHLKKNNLLKEKLKSLPYKIFLFSNAQIHRVTSILKILELTDVFHCHFVGDHLSTELVLKPKPEAYEFVQRAIGVEPERIHFFDDTVRNVEGAKAVGWNTYQVKGDIMEQIDRVLMSIKSQKK